MKPCIVREVAASGDHRSYVCDVWMHVDFVSVYSEPKALLLSCEGAVARARRAGADILAGGEGQCPICMEELLAEDDRVSPVCPVARTPFTEHASSTGSKWRRRARPAA